MASTEQSALPSFRVPGRRLRLARWLFAVALVALLSGACAWLLSAPRPQFAAHDTILEGGGDAERGRLVFAAGDCASCHASPGQADRLRLGGGLALASPFGIFRVPNISPHLEDGIGRWTTADLANALLSGVSPEGSHYYPAFPYTSFTGMQLSDIRDLMAYLRTLPPVAGKAPPHDLGPLMRIRRLVGLWKLLYFRQGGTPRAQSGDPVLDRGAYLVESVAHCAECHSTRNMAGAIVERARFAGGPDPEGVGFVPNITPVRIGHWSERDITDMLASGNTPDHGRVGSSMADVVTNLAMLPQSDRDAIARYVKSLPARETPHP